MLRLLVTTSVVPSSPSIVALMMEALRSSAHGLTFQKTFFIVTAVKASDLTGEIYAQHDL
jgi:hypothetical protein